MTPLQSAADVATRAEIAAAQLRLEVAAARNALLPPTYMKLKRVDMTCCGVVASWLTHAPGCKLGGVS